MGSSSVFIDHYAILGVPPDASSEQIKSSFRRLALEVHPDTGGEDHLRFVEVYNAYRILSQPESRKRFHQQYNQYQAQKRAPERAKISRPRGKRISPARFIYPQNIAELARRGLLQKKFRVRDRRFFLKIDYDLELPLRAEELGIPISLSIPSAARRVCPDCLGSDTQCVTCDGRGYQKTSATIELTLVGGLLFDQILEVDLTGLKPAPMTHFRKKKIRIKISRQSNRDEIKEQYEAV